MRLHVRLWAAVVPFVLAGCFTLKETPVPQVRMTPAPAAKDLKIQLTGFGATVLHYVPVYGSQTYFVDGPGVIGAHGRVYAPGGHLQTVSTETLVPQIQATDMFARRAQGAFEENGYLLAAKAPYTVDVSFEGPFETDGERAVETAWMFCSVLSAEYATQTWRAKLKIYDTASGRVVFHHDYEQKYELCVWSPLFFIGLSGVTKDGPSAMQYWCLSVLTDRVCADASAYLAQCVTAAPFK